MNVRSASAADVPALLDLDRQSPTSAHWSRQQYDDMLAGPGEASRRLVLVLDDTPDGGQNISNSSASCSAESRIIGFLVAHHIAPDWELENIVTAPASRRKGLATQLFAALVTHARETNSQSVFLEVRDSNRAARGLYAQLGFTETGRRKLYYANPPDDAVLYRLDLARLDLVQR